MKWISFILGLPFMAIGFIWALMDHGFKAGRLMYEIYVLD